MGDHSCQWLIAKIVHNYKKEIGPENEYFTEVEEKVYHGGG